MTHDVPAPPPRLVLLANFLAPYRLAVLERLASLIPTMEMWVSASSESDRSWTATRTEVFPVKHVAGLSIRRGRPGKPGQDLHLPVSAFPRLVAAGPDVVLASEMGFRTLSAAAYAAVARRSRLVVWATLSERTERGRSARRTATRKALLRAADAVVVNGPSGARYIRSLSPHIPIYVVHQAAPLADSDLPVPYEVERRAELQLLYVGQLIERKGLHLTLPVVAEWARASGRRVAIDLVGDGPMREALEALCDRIGLDATFRGAFEYQQTVALYAQYDALFLPSLEDEWALVVNEALQSGIPVLGSVHAQAVECLVTDGVNGATFDPENVRTLDPALDRLALLLKGDRDSVRSHCIASMDAATIETMAQGLAAAILGRPDGQFTGP